MKSQEFLSASWWAEGMRMRDEGKIRGCFFRHSNYWCAGKHAFRDEGKPLPVHEDEGTTAMMECVEEVKRSMEMNNSVHRHIVEPYGPYAHLYQHFFANRHTHHGYLFGEAPTVGVSPPVPIHHSRPLKWWSWDRPKRLQKVRAERDRRLQEIIQLKKTPSICTGFHPLPIWKLPFEIQKQSFSEFDLRNVSRSK